MTCLDEFLVLERLYELAGWESSGSPHSSKVDSNYANDLEIEMVGKSGIKGSEIEWSAQISLR